MLTILRTDSKNADFILLVSQLDAYLRITDGEEHAFYDQYNKIDSIKYAIVAYMGSKPVACGAIKEFKKDIVEVKRMFVVPGERGKGIASKLLLELENWAIELCYHKAILETGKRQEEALILYAKNAYKIRENYGQYEGLENSVCFEKLLT